MHCPFCASHLTQVLETRYQEDDNSIKRKRRCEECNSRFVTFEVVQICFPLVIKKDGITEAYQRKKLEKSMIIALRKRPVSLQTLEQAISNIEKSLLLTAKKQVDSQYIGILMLEQLKSIDKVAYIRFASVYQNFEDISDFNHMLQQLGKSSDE